MNRVFEICATVFLFICDYFVIGSIVSVNPYSNYELYVPSTFTTNVASSISLHPDESEYYSIVASQSVALWIDSTDEITTLSTELSTMSALATSNNKNYAITIVLFDIPNRQCSSSINTLYGDFECSDHSCTSGISSYKTDFIDSIYTVLSGYSSNTMMQINIIIEPQALANLATSTGSYKCQLAKVAYYECLGYAIEILSYINNVAIYLDAAHGGWLGWPTNSVKYATIVNNLINNVTSSIRSITPNTVNIDGSTVSVDLTFSANELIRGFSSNIASFEPLGCVSGCTEDACDRSGLLTYSETLFIESISEYITDGGGFTNIGGWIIDTSRNGNVDARSSCSNWCNIANAGIGELPTSDSNEINDLTGSDLIDALLWIKNPGTSDGTNNSTNTFYSSTCDDTTDALYEYNAPIFNKWFDEYFVNLVENANPAITTNTIQTTSDTDIQTTDDSGDTGGTGGTAGTGGMDTTIEPMSTEIIGNSSDSGV